MLLFRFFLIKPSEICKAPQLPSDFQLLTMARLLCTFALALFLGSLGTHGFFDVEAMLCDQRLRDCANSVGVLGGENLILRQEIDQLKKTLSELKASSEKETQKNAEFSEQQKVIQSQLAGELSLVKEMYKNATKELNEARAKIQELTSQNVLDEPCGNLTEITVILRGLQSQLKTTTETVKENGDLIQKLREENKYLLTNILDLNNTNGTEDRLNINIALMRTKHGIPRGNGELAVTGVQ